MENLHTDVMALRVNNGQTNSFSKLELSVGALSINQAWLSWKERS